MRKKLNKIVFTKIILKELGKTIHDSVVAEYMPLWWQNTRQKEKGGLRLTEAGIDALTEAGIQTYTIPFPLDMPLTTQTIIFLDQFIDCPYYLTNKNVIVTNERKAVELTLFSGDIRKYGMSKALQRTERT